MFTVVPLIAAIAPFILWPIELFLPYPYIIEELLKATLIYFVIDLSNKATQIKITLASGLIFSLSETILYIFNISLVGDLTTLLTRFTLTTILHSLTMFIILISSFKTKWLMPTGVLVAMLIHYLFNMVIPNIFT